MRKATLKIEDARDNRNDAQPIVEALWRLGIEISLRDAWEAWEKHSESMAAGWLFLPDTDEEILSSISYYLDIKDEDVCDACSNDWDTGHTCDGYRS